MARASSQDPIDKFRFIVHAYDLVNDINPSFSNSFFSAGFSEIQLPKISIGVIQYKENNQSSFIKKPGLARTDDLVLRKGKTPDTSFYEWLVSVFDPAAHLSAWLTSLSSQSIVNISTVQNPALRKDLLISSLDRTGNYVKHWYIYECFPSQYRPGNDFSASADEKLIEELTVTCEGFVEVEGNTLEDALANVAAAPQKALEKAASAAALAAVGGLGDLLTTKIPF